MLSETLPRRLTKEQLRAVGAALYGFQWVQPLSFELDVAPRTMRRWSVGTELIPETLTVDILALLVQRRGEIAKLETDLMR